MATSFLGQTTHSPVLLWTPRTGTLPYHTLHHPKTSRVVTAPCPGLRLLWEADELTPEKLWTTFNNLLCYIFLVTAQMILFPGESGSGAWWGHLQCCLLGRCWHSWRPPRKTRTTWHPPRSARGSHKPELIPPREWSGLTHSVDKNITSRKNFICEEHPWAVGWALAPPCEIARELFGFVLFIHADKHFSLGTAKIMTVYWHLGCYNWSSITLLCLLLF